MTRMPLSFVALALLIATAVVSSSSTPSFARDGVAGGNGELYLPRNSDGEPIEISLGGKHPFQDRLLTLLKNAKLPFGLKQEMIKDLEITTIIYSNEILKVKDLTAQLMLVLRERKVSTTTDSRGRKKETIEETWENREVAPQLGISIMPVNYKVEGVEDTYVAAYTSTHPRTVIYFSKFTSQMDEIKAFGTVFHEQAHRISALGPRKYDERFVEAWANALPKYLVGQMTEAEFYQILRSIGISTAPSPDFPDEVSNANGTHFSTRLNILLSPEDIIFHDHGPNGYFLHVASTAFKEYPIIFEDANYQMIYIARATVPSLRLAENQNSLSAEHEGGLFPLHHWDARVARDFARSLVNATAPTPLELKITYSKEFPKVSTGLVQQVYSMKDMVYSPMSKYLPLLAQVRSDMSEHPFMHVASLSNQFYWQFTPDATERLLAVNRQIARYFTDMRTQDPALYETLSTYPTVIKYTSSNQDGIQIARTEGAQWMPNQVRSATFVISIDSRSDAEFSLSEFEKDISSLPEAEIEAIRKRRLNQRFQDLNDRLGMTLQYADDTHPQALDVLEKFIRSQGRLLKGMACMAHELKFRMGKVKSVELYLGVGSDLLRWSYGNQAEYRFAEQGTSPLPFMLSIPNELLSRPEQWAQLDDVAVFTVIRSSLIFEDRVGFINPSYSTYHLSAARWKPSKRKPQLVLDREHRVHIGYGLQIEHYRAALKECEAQALKAK